MPEVLHVIDPAYCRVLVTRAFSAHYARLLPRTMEKPRRVICQQLAMAWLSAVTAGTVHRLIRAAMETYGCPPPYSAFHGVFDTPDVPRFCIKHVAKRITDLDAEAA